MINEFRGKYYFLSNFYTAPVEYDGLLYQNNEAAFQSVKCINKKDRKQFTNLPPNKAKGLGRRVKLRNDWEEVKDRVMYDIVKDKFIRNKDLKEKLLATGDRYLEEGNWWNDTYWGVCNGKGQNKLGAILMQVREEIKNQ